MERIDTRHTVETPEGVDFHIQPAGPVPRLQAAAVDLVIRLFAFFFIAFLFMSLGDAGFGVGLIAFFVLYWGYSIIFEMYFDGMTPGKRLYDLQVRNADGTPVSWRGSILRNLLRVVDFLPFGYSAGIVAMTATGRFQRLGDLAGDTVVCYRKDGELPDIGDLPKAESIKAPARLTLEEQRAIVKFAARSLKCNEDRTRELAEIAEPLTGESDPKEGVENLKGLANGILHGS